MTAILGSTGKSIDRRLTLIPSKFIGLSVEPSATASPDEPKSKAKSPKKKKKNKDKKRKLSIENQSSSPESRRMPELAERKVKIEPVGTGNDVEPVMANVTAQEHKKKGTRIPVFGSDPTSFTVPVEKKKKRQKDSKGVAVESGLDSKKRKLDASPSGGMQPQKKQKGKKKKKTS